MQKKPPLIPEKADYVLLINRQSVTSRSREFPFPGILHFFYGIGTGIFQNISVDLGPGLVPFPGFL